MKSATTVLFVSMLVLKHATTVSGLCDEGRYSSTDGSAEVNISLECNTTHLVSTITIDAERPYFYYSYSFGIRCFDVNSSQTVMLDLHNGGHFPNHHTFTTVQTLNYGWECVLFGCYDEYASKQRHFAVNPAYCLVDEDECSTNSHYCNDMAFCTNIIGSYNCSCWDGYEGDGFSCSDIDECQQSGHNCSDKAQCWNIPGGFSCSCSGSYTGDGYNCTDVDECTDSTDICGPHSVCENVAGSYQCSCNEGFSYSLSLCRDIDECESDSHQCSNGVCHNLPGGYNCSCRDGYVGDGYNCTDSESFYASKETLVTVSFTAVLVCVVALCVAGLTIRRFGSRKKPWWLDAYWGELGKQELDQNFKPVDPEPSQLLSASLNSIIEPLQKQNELVVSECCGKGELEQSSTEHRTDAENSFEEAPAQSSISETAMFPDFHSELSEHPVFTTQASGDPVILSSAVSFDEMPHMHSSLFCKDESGFVSATSSFQYLSFNELCHHV